MKYGKKIAAVLLSVMMILTMMPAMAFAEDEDAAPEEAAAEVIGDVIAAEDEQEAETEEPVTEEVQEDVAVEEADSEETAADPEEYDEGSSDDGEVYDESDVGYEEMSLDEVIEPEDLEGVEGAETEELMEEFFAEPEPGELSAGSSLSPKSVKGDRLSGNALKFYNYFKSIITTVFNAKSSEDYMTSSKKVKLSTILGKRTFTAKELGVEKIGYKKNGTWYVSSAAKKKIQALVSTSTWDTSWRKIYTSLLSDLSSQSYWVDWYSESNPNNKSYQFIVWDCEFSYNRSSLTFSSYDSITFRLPVIKEFMYDEDAFKASTSSIKDAATAKTNAKNIVKAADSNVASLLNNGWTREEVDVYRLQYYCERIAALNTYDDEAAESNSGNKGGPWSMIPVFDNDSSTNVVCAGYARAFKYLCDLSTFRSNWIDCQIVSGYTDVGKHMWNLVRMYDGLNYLVDPTWMDNDDKGGIRYEWFLRGDPDGTASRYTINGRSREYEDLIIKTFASAERKLAKKSYYQYVTNPKTIVLKKPVIKTPTGGKKKITVKWKKVTSPLGAMYIDGYQIRYSTKSSMSGAKIVKVKGYNKAIKVIKNLKSKKYYYVQVRTYAKMGSTTYKSKWSTKKKVRTK